MNTFEWYYFDIHSDSGFDIVITFHSKPFNTIFPIVLLDIFIYKDNKLFLHHIITKPDSECFFNAEPFQIRLDELNYIKWVDNKFEIAANDKNIKLNILFNYEKSFNIPEHNYELFPNGEQNKKFKWAVRAPLCPAECEFTYRDQQFNFTGIGYHDTNFGNINFKKDLKKWFWGKYYIDDKLLIFGEIISKNNESRKICLYYDNQTFNFDNNPEKVVNDDQILINTSFRNFKFQIKNTYKIDCVRFYMFNLNKHFIFLGKVFELISHILSKYNKLSFLQRKFANVTYYRFKQILSYDKHDFECFNEKIIF